MLNPDRSSSRAMVRVPPVFTAPVVGLLVLLLLQATRVMAATATSAEAVRNRPGRPMGAPFLLVSSSTRQRPVVVSRLLGSSETVTYLLPKLRTET